VRILVSSIIDIRRAAPNRLHHLLKHLSQKHEITALCVNDWQKPDSSNMSIYDSEFSSQLDAVDIEYVTNKRISAFQQEAFFPLFNKHLDGDYDLIFNYNTLVSGCSLSKRLNIPMIYDLADDLPAMISSYPGIPSFLRPLGKRFGERMMDRTISRSAKVTGITLSIQENYSIPRDSYELLPNGVNTGQFSRTEDSLRDTYGLADNFVLGYVGVLREWVDFTWIFLALSRLDGVKLLVVGSEGLLNENKKLAQDYGVKDKVIFAGNVPYNEVPGHISAMDACVIPFNHTAIAQQAHPLKLLEYMACEKPVVSSNLRGVKEAAGDLVLYAENQEDYIKHIRLLSNGSNISEDLGKRGREFVVKNYDWGSISKRLEELMEGLV
jgi:glycosyltransferase involved in cell wall biosynthesis